MTCSRFFSCGACLLSFFGVSCGGPAFDTVSSSPDSGLVTTPFAEGGDTPESGELEAASDALILGEGANPKKVDAGAEQPEAASFFPICNTTTEFQRECVLWAHHELTEAGTCWDRCGTCEGIGAVCIRKE